MFKKKAFVILKGDGKHEKLGGTGKLPIRDLPENDEIHPVTMN